MNFIADLHVHSPFSRATSRECSLAGLAAWARVKGIQVVGTGDFTHPGWFRRLKEELVPAEPGLFRLKDEAAVTSPLAGVTLSSSPVRFLLSAEVSSIYKRHGATRKVHNLLYLPDFASAERINARLAGIGNIESDGRPILGLDSRDLLEIVLEQAPEGFLVPAHIWTPWFSLFGSRSGFDSVEECFGDLSPHVFALETGLSSDPEMNRLVSALDRFTLISNSDCHSPQKLGRESNLFATELDFFAMRDALKGEREGFRSTVEFFPEEGKYHADGHRACGVCLDPHETRQLGLLCPVCGKPLTVGVAHRLLELADRERPVYPEGAPGFTSLIPLPEVLGEILGVGPGSKEVLKQYGRTIARFGSEFDLLLRTPVEEIRDVEPLLGEAVERVRSGRVIRRPGYDGEFGVIRVFEERERERLAGQGSLFGDGGARRGRKRMVRSMESAAPLGGPAGRGETAAAPAAPNPEQEAAIWSRGGQILVTAGPGTGKTFTLVARLAALLAEGADPSRVVAITFTNKAAAEVAERLDRVAGERSRGIFVGTFHAFALHWLRQETPGLTVVGPESRERLLKRLFPDLTAGERGHTSASIADHFLKAGRGMEEKCVALGQEPSPSTPLERYLAELSRLGALDLDGIVPALVERLASHADFRRRVSAAVEDLFVDEFQDLNASQYALVEILAEGARVFAIGDPDQAIYGFRGSDPSFFSRFSHLPATTRLFLSRNYRSAPQIVAGATAVIARNDGPGRLTLVPEAVEDGRIELHTAPTPAAEGEFIVRRIEELMGGIEHFSLHTGRGGDGRGGRGRSFADFAILVRLAKQAGEIGEALSRRGIPFQLVGGTPFYMEKSLRAAYYFLQAAAGSPVMADWLLLLRDMPGIGTATIERLEGALPLTGDFFSSLPAAGLSQGAGGTIAGLSGAIDRFVAQVPGAGIASPLAGTLPFLGIDPAHPDSRRFLELAGGFGGELLPFARHLREYAAATVYDERAEAVALMTLHAAKGLEFPVVFLSGVEEGIIPCTLMGKGDVEEERRLFYVGMTRARHHLILTTAASRPWAGNGGRKASRFIAEIPEELLTPAAPQIPRRKRGVPDSGQLELF